MDPNLLNVYGHNLDLAIRLEIHNGPADEISCILVESEVDRALDQTAVFASEQNRSLAAMHFYAQEYSKALGRTITFQDIPVEPWRAGLLERGLPVHLVNHLATMADLHRAGRYDRMSDDVLTLTGQGPLSVQEFVRKNAATFTASAKEA